MATPSTHVIRLRGPWQLELLATFAVGPDGGYSAQQAVAPILHRATMPADWSESLGPEFLGRVHYTRTFQKPTGLEQGERVWLVVEPPRSLGTVRLADQQLGTVQYNGLAGRFDVTSLLADRNLLEITVEHPALDDTGKPTDDSDFQAAGGLVGEVRLEIEPAE